MIILFVRHANSVDDKLTEIGKKECELAILQEENIKFSKIYSSPKNRCIETAKYFSNRYNLDIEICEGLTERGLLNKEPETEDEKLWYDNYLNPKFSSKNPEGCKEFLKRTYNVFKKIVKENKNVIVVGHSATFYSLMSFINGFNKNGKINWTRIANCNKVYFEIKD